jgi:hypothetical protein
MALEQLPEELLLTIGDHLPNKPLRPRSRSLQNIFELPARTSEAAAVVDQAWYGMVGCVDEWRSRLSKRAREQHAIEVVFGSEWKDIRRPKRQRAWGAELGPLRVPYASHEKGSPQTG